MTVLTSRPANRTCVMCKEDFYYGNTYLPDNNLCGSDYHLYELWEIRDKPNVARIKGEHYMIGDEADKFKGFGGQSFTIAFNDGREVTTTNLWHQGDIPAHWQKLGMTDNAKFVEEAE